MRSSRFIAILMTAAFSALTGMARADTTATGTSTSGTLVYNFTYSASQNIAARDDTVQGVDPLGALSGGSNGMSHYGGTLTDKGTMTVNIVKKQADGALVVMISEQGESIRRASPAECVVYGNTNVICDPNKTVYSEEYTLLRFLAANFVDPSRLDSNKHWQIVQDVNNDHVTADYVVDSNNNGAMNIGEKRTIRQMGAGHLKTDIDTKIGYDFTRTVPTSIDEYAQQYTDAGIKGSQRTIYQTTLQLVSDTTAKN